MTNNKVFSEYEMKEISMKFIGEETASRAGCLGSLEETLDSKTITKKCEGVEQIVAVKGTGKGELKISIHIPYEIYLKMYGMKLDSLIKGVNGYGQSSIHGKFSITGKVYDEDGICKLKAYPNCIIKDGISRKIENGSEEVAEIDLTVGVNPDEEGFGMYEAPVDDLDTTKKDEFITNWMTKFTTDLVHIPVA